MYFLVSVIYEEAKDTSLEKELRLSLLCLRLQYALA